MKSVKKIVSLFVVSVLIVCQGAQAAEEVTYYHVDILNSIVAATDINGDRKWEEEYYPHGNMTNDKGIDNNTIKDNAQWYTGKTKDDDTGLMYMGSRWYDPTIGRFYGVDPQQVNPNDVHTFNRYAYANNNPYKYIDPTGEFVVLIPAVIWAVGTALTAYDSYQVYRNEGALAAGKTLATGAALTATTGGIGKIAVNAIRYLKPVSSSIKAEAKVVAKSAGKEIGTITTRTTKNKTRLGGGSGEPGVKIKYKDGTEFDMTRTRVKETEVNPYKPGRTKHKQFDNALDNKGIKRAPTNGELDWFNSINF